MTQEELLNYFKIQMNRPDWTMNDLISAQLQTSMYLVEMDRSIKSIIIPSLTNEQLNSILNELNILITNIQTEVNRRS